MAALVDECDTRDLVLVRINELRSIMLLRDLIRAAGLEQERYREMRLHCIHGDEERHGRDLGERSTFEPVWLFEDSVRPVRGRPDEDR